MKIIVTGGAGFIGGAAIRYLLRHTEATVVNVDKLTYAGNLESLASVESSVRYSFAQIDIVDGERLDRLFQQHRPDAVLHLAAESHVDRSIDGPEAFIATNLVGTFRLLQSARKYWEANGSPDAFRFVHVSTDEVYGDLDELDQLFHETTPYAPSSPYSASKAGSDHLARAWGHTYGLPVIVTNCSNNYGPYQFPEKLIPHMILNALENKGLPVYGDGKQVRDWLYVDDHARALWDVLTRGEPGETYNIGGHNEIANIGVVHAICDLLDAKLGSSASKKDLVHFVKDRPGHDRRYAIDASKIERQLGWTPREDFRSGLEKTVDWYLGNEPWWRRILDGSYRLGRLGQPEPAQ